MHTELIQDISWVGAIDWNIRDFHGYQTERGSTYNAYLIRDEYPALVDTVKAPFASELMANISEAMAGRAIHYIICNHAEPDHSGSVPAMLKHYPQAEVVCNAKCRAALAQHYDTASWAFRIVKDGDRLSLGKRTLQFMDTPMVHWPESMFTYIAEDRLLFSMDAFGQHLASSARFDDEAPLDVIMAEAKTYYANILMPYGQPIARTLERAKPLPIDLIAPSHGIIWRRNIPTILQTYRDWTEGKITPKVLVIYDTMYGSTAHMAQAIFEGTLEPGIESKLIAIRSSNLTLLATEMLDTAAIAFGSPTLNTTLMPQAAAVLAYLKGLRPAGKSGFAFGSYGWSKGGAQAVADALSDMKFPLLRDPIQSQYVPTLAGLEECRQAGKLLADTARTAINFSPSEKFI
ncbi:MAG: FprA family A-type flavoprotein [Verrucomicrobia bacterium]|nr:FprA family A-type flavoprotein [Verrucomicrobiota bacterium]MCG2680194.1 FprA family A-type flavoprotein [Kiritimatiellia bacterium]MBU4247512.1 FprA family A-type flavoprotein [Verrucomicrobiota bacterium]MBU4289481.1 FprA family A-type flavoprotein [Verrucomicrobiota bacterium]MBU4429956.1 FprA family A-type flavoprotein [Verrucomicrobiota bacterium]